jgi:hypothetical protein
VQKCVFVANLHKAFAPIFATILLGFSLYSVASVSRIATPREKREAKSPAKNLKGLDSHFILSLSFGTTKTEVHCIFAFS